MKGRRTVVRVFAVGLVLVLICTSSVAQDSAPQSAMGTAFTYQGRLTDGSGPVDGDCDLRFKLYNAAGGGTQIDGTETLTRVQVSDGLFTVQLDFGAEAFNGQPRWLEISVRCPAGSGSYVQLSPRQPLTPAPYALYAAESGDGTSGGAHDHWGDSWHGTGTGLNLNSSNGIGLLGQHDSTSGSEPGVKGVTRSTSQNATGMLGEVWPTSPGSWSVGVRGINQGTGAEGIGVYGEHKGEGWGVYGISASSYAGYFYGDIRVIGNCVGCAMAYVGLNDGGEPLETGDLVAVSGVSSPLLGTTAPVLRVRRADAGNASAVVGVVGSKAHNVGRQSDGSQEIDNVVRAEGPAAPGDHVFIVVQGLAQVKVDARGGAVRAGDTLTVAGSLAGHTTQALEGNGELRVGRAMESVEGASGLIWAMVDVQ